MVITKITDDLIGKKITCKIQNTYIDDAEITKNGNIFFILQNLKDGNEARNKKGYKYSWVVDYGSSSELRTLQVKDIKLKQNSYPIW